MKRKEQRAKARRRFFPDYEGWGLLRRCGEKEWNRLVLFS